MMRMALIIFIIVFTCLLVVVSVAFGSTQLKLPIIEVIDGDTIRTQIPLPAPLNQIKIRVLGIDTPEMPAESYKETGKLGRANCNLEAERALRAKKFVEDLVNQSLTYMNVTNFKWDKFGGRIDGDVYLINKETLDEINLGEMLIEKGYAVEYNGGTKTTDWCQLFIN